MFLRQPGKFKLFWHEDRDKLNLCSLPKQRLREGRLLAVGFRGTEVSVAGWGNSYLSRWAGLSTGEHSTTLNLSSF